MTNGLHRIKDAIVAYDYQTGFAIINELVSSGSFSLLSQFLPGIKVLLQVAAQSGVYYAN